MTNESEGALAALVRNLNRAVRPAGPVRCCEGVKRALMDAVAEGNGFLPRAFHRTLPDRYARRLLHLDPDLRYSVVVMAWHGYQGTPIHDHGGLWCVECVYRGRIRVTSYRPTGPRDASVQHFLEERVVHAAVGDAGALIPPFEYHQLSNAGADTAITIHVYGGELTHCHVYEPDGNGGYLRSARVLGYDL